MEPDEAAANVTRRDFLMRLGCAAGALAAVDPGRVLAGPAVARAFDAAPACPPLKIGVLLPGSRLYPRLAANLLDGMDVYLRRLSGNPQSAIPNRKFEVPVTLLPEDLGLAPRAAGAGARRLIAEEHVDLLGGVVGPGAAPRLRDLCAETRTFLVVADAGAHVVAPADESPWVFTNSLGYWQASWAMGEWARRHVGRRAFLASCFHESGYDALPAFRRGFEAAGGRVVEMGISHVPPDGHHLAPLMEAIRRSRADCVIAFHTGGFAVDFLRAYERAGLSGRMPLLGSTFLGEPAGLRALGKAALGMRSCVAWAPSLANAANREFTHAFREQTGRDPDSFAALGCDTAQWVVAAAAAAGGVRRPEAFRAALGSARIAGPRGILTPAAGTRQGCPPLYLSEVRQQGGRLYNAVVAELDGVSPRDRRVAALSAGPRSGWTHAYLNA